MPKWNLRIALQLRDAVLLLTMLTAHVAETCNVTYRAADAAHGYITSVNYPRSYPAGVNCEYHFFNAKDTRLSLTFTEFDLREPVPGTDGQCAFDFVDIFVIDDDRSPMKMLGRKCGRVAPNQLATAASHVIVYFKSRSAINSQNTGFRADFTFTNETFLLTPNQLDSSEDSICGVTRLRGTGGILTAPSLSGGRGLRPKDRQALLQSGMINCTWTIRITEGDKILINFMSLNLGPSEVVCHESYLLMYNSVSDIDRSSSLEKICGRLSLFPGKSKQYVSMGPWLTIRFIYRLPSLPRLTTKGPGKHSDPTAASAPDESTLAPTVASAFKVEPNFRLVWTAIWSLREEEECPGFECKGSLACLDAEKVVCHETPRYCIHPTLRCDGISHCGPKDTSDEENCQLPLILSGVAAGVGILLSLVAIVALIVWRVRMPKQKRTKARPWGKPQSRAVKAGAPQHLGQMLEHLADKRKVTTEYTAVITNENLINTRSIIASMAAQDDSKTAADGLSNEKQTSSSSLLSRHSTRPVGIKPSVVVNRETGLVSVRFAPATPPAASPQVDDATSTVEEAKEVVDGAVQTPLLLSPEKSAETSLAKLARSSTARSSSASAEVKQEAASDNQSCPPPPAETALDDLVTEKKTTPDRKTLVSEEESSLMSFPPPPTNEDILLLSAAPAAALPAAPSTPCRKASPPGLNSLQNSTAVPVPAPAPAQHHSKSPHFTYLSRPRHYVPSSSDDERFHMTKDAPSRKRTHHHRLHHHHHHHQHASRTPGVAKKEMTDARLRSELERHSDGNGSPQEPIDLSLPHGPNRQLVFIHEVPLDLPPEDKQTTTAAAAQKVPSGADAKDIARVVQRDANDLPTHRSKSPRKPLRHRSKGPEFPPPPPETDFQWELRPSPAPPASSANYAKGASTLPHVYANIDRVTASPPLGPQSPDSLATKSPRVVPTSVRKKTSSSSSSYRPVPSDSKTRTDESQRLEHSGRAKEKPDKDSFEKDPYQTTV